VSDLLEIQRFFGLNSARIVESWRASHINWFDEQGVAGCYSRSQNIYRRRLCGR
jgi:hypothetical protein